MKKFITALLACMALLFVSTPAVAQDAKNPFEGKWVLNTSTPMGEMEMSLEVATVDGKPTAKLESTEVDGTIEADDVKVTDKTIVFYIFAQGMDVDFALTLDEKDNTLAGDMLGQFPVSGKKAEKE